MGLSQIQYSMNHDINDNGKYKSGQWNVWKTLDGCQDVNWDRSGVQNACKVWL